jgi:hypothetical protein
MINGLLDVHGNAAVHDNQPHIGPKSLSIRLWWFIEYVHFGFLLLYFGRIFCSIESSLSPGVWIWIILP